MYCSYQTEYLITQVEVITKCLYQIVQRLYFVCISERKIVNIKLVQMLGQTVHLVSISLGKWSEACNLLGLPVLPSVGMVADCVGHPLHGGGGRARLPLLLIWRPGPLWRGRTANLQTSHHWSQRSQRVLRFTDAASSLVVQLFCQSLRSCRNEFLTLSQLLG